MKVLKNLLMALLAACMLLAPTFTLVTHANAAPDPQRTARAATYLQKQFQKNGGQYISDGAGGYFNKGVTPLGIMALISAGVDSSDYQGAVKWLRSNLSEKTDYEECGNAGRVTTWILAINENPKTFLGNDVTKPFRSQCENFFGPYAAGWYLIGAARSNVDIPQNELKKILYMQTGRKESLVPGYTDDAGMFLSALTLLLRENKVPAALKDRTVELANEAVENLTGDNITDAGSGGGYYSGPASTVQSVGLAIGGLHDYLNTPQVSSATHQKAARAGIKKLETFLANEQNTDGGFGKNSTEIGGTRITSTNSEPWPTAQAMIGLTEISYATVQAPAKPALTTDSTNVPQGGKVTLTPVHFDKGTLAFKAGEKVITPTPKGDGYEWTVPDDQALGELTLTVENKVASQSATTKITVTEPKVTSVDNPKDVTTEAGKKPTLPETVTVHYDNGKTKALPVTWNLTDEQWKGRKGGEFNLTGTIEGLKDKTASLKLTVTPLEVKSVVIKGTDSLEYAETVASGTKPKLPSTAEITWNDETKEDAAITWTKDTEYNKREAGKYTLTGTIAGSDKTATATITRNAATKVSAEPPADVTTKVKTAPQLPKTVKVTWSNKDVTDESVAWDKVTESQYAQEGSFKVQGSVDGLADKVSVTVTVVPNKIVSVLNPKDITVESGTAPALPETVTVTYDDGTIEAVAVTWDKVTKDQYSKREGGSFTVSGTLAKTDKKPQVKVIVNPAVVKSAVIDGRTDLTYEGTIESGTKPTLPAKAKLTWSNGDTETVTIKWQEPTKAQYNDRAAGDFTLEGTVPNWDKKATATIHRNAATPKEWQSFDKKIRTTPKVAPDLPKTTEVTWSNGDKTMEPIVWEKIDESKYAQAGKSFEVTGTVAKGTIKLTVEVTDAHVTKLSAPKAVTTDYGVAPKLPSTLTATWSDGATSLVAVAWKPVDVKAMPHNGGTFHVDGTVKSINKVARMQYTVNRDPAWTPLQVKAVVAKVAQGGVQTFEAFGFEPGLNVTFKVNEMPALVGTAKADAKGYAKITWKVPADFAVASHTVVASQTVAGLDKPLTAQDDFQVVKAGAAMKPGHKGSKANGLPVTGADPLTPVALLVVSGLVVAAIAKKTIK